MSAVKEWSKATKIVTKVQYHWFQRELLSVEKGYGTGEYTAEEIHALLLATDYMALPERQGVAKLCGCMRCGLKSSARTVSTTSPAPTAKPSPSRCECGWPSCGHGSWLTRSWTTTRPGRWRSGWA